MYACIGECGGNEVQKNNLWTLWQNIFIRIDVNYFKFYDAGDDLQVQGAG